MTIELWHENVQSKSGIYTIKSDGISINNECVTVGDGYNKMGAYLRGRSS